MVVVIILIIRSCCYGADRINSVLLVRLIIGVVVTVLAAMIVLVLVYQFNLMNIFH